MCQVEGHPNGVIVLGPPRSGTSMVCQLLDRLGVGFGAAEEMGRPDRFNPGGYYERIDLVEANNRLLESAGRTFAAPGSPDTLHRDGDPSVLDGVDLSWTREHGRWALKDPRFCATLLTWGRSGRLDLGSARLIVVSRELDAIVRSALAYPNVSGHFKDSPDRVRAGMEVYAELAEVTAGSLSLPTLRLGFEQILAEPGQEVSRLAEFIGCTDAESISQAASGIGAGRAGTMRGTFQLAGARLRAKLEMVKSQRMKERRSRGAEEQRE